MGLIVRWVFAFLLVAVTFNPTDWNYFRWAMSNSGEQMSMVVLLGLVLVVAYVVYVRATLRSIGAFGMALVLAVVAALIWVLYDLGLLSLENRNFNVWIGIFALSAVLGIGLSWSIIRRALSGQYDMDDVDE